MYPFCFFCYGKQNLKGLHLFYKFIQKLEIWAINNLSRETEKRSGNEVIKFYEVAKNLKSVDVLIFDNGSFFIGMVL